MAFKLDALVIFSVLFLLFLSSEAAAQPAPEPSPSQEAYGGVEVIRNVESNKEVQALGKFAVDEVNREVSYSEAITFEGVVTAKRWQGVYGWDYFFVIKSEKTVTKKEGRLLVYVYTYSYGMGVKAWIFEPTTYA